MLRFLKVQFYKSVFAPDIVQSLAHTIQETEISEQGVHEPTNNWLVAM